MPLCTLIHFAHVIWVTESQGNRSNQNSPLKVNPDDLCLHSCKKSAVKKHLHIDLLPNSAETDSEDEVLFTMEDPMLFSIFAEGLQILQHVCPNGTT